MHLNYLLLVVLSSSIQFTGLVQAGNWFQSDMYKAPAASKDDSGSAWLSGNYDTSDNEPPSPPPAETQPDYQQQQRYQFPSGGQNTYQQAQAPAAYPNNQQQQQQFQQNPQQQSPPQVQVHQFHPGHQQHQQQQQNQMGHQNNQGAQQGHVGQQQHHLQNQNPNTQGNAMGGQGQGPSPHHQTQPHGQQGHHRQNQQHGGQPGHHSQFPPQQESVEEESWKKKGDTNPFFFEQPKEAVTFSPEDEKFRQEKFGGRPTKWDIEDEDTKAMQNLRNTQGQVVYEKAYLTKQDLLNEAKGISHQAVVNVGARGQQQPFNPQQQIPHKPDPFQLQLPPPDYYKGKIQEDPNSKRIIEEANKLYHQPPRRNPPPIPHPPPAQSGLGNQQQLPPLAGNGNQQQYLDQDNINNARSRQSHRMDNPPGEIIYRDRWFDDDEMYDSGSCSNFECLQYLTAFIVVYIVLFV